ncbi:rubrerythrin subfamily [Candidatus Moduliflexus flocculans]|uniref:Rubrerythrin subfamily n=1 Tax=Candidatus Moduliflexus flocculans TaxID=1499966 RepID=A0A081BTH0_9BACT|nr:rubrerythrin subfamily [Candidatus Moduliflexus flocculans]
MGTLFDIHEIVNFAIQREQESLELYRTLAEQVQPQELKNIFLLLMEEERQHRVYYVGLLAALAQQADPSLQRDEEYDAYMRVLLDSGRISKTLPVDMENLQATIDYAIGREKDAVLFYTGLEQYVPAKDRETVRGIVREEARHIVKLTHIKAELLM